MAGQSAGCTKPGMKGYETSGREKLSQSNDSARAAKSGIVKTRRGSAGQASARKG